MSSIESIRSAFAEFRKFLFVPRTDIWTMMGDEFEAQEKQCDVIFLVKNENLHDEPSLAGNKKIEDKIGSSYSTRTIYDHISQD
jgi:hypothetical protein